MLLELLVLGECHIRRQHHQRLGLGIRKLSRSVPLSPRPLFVKQQSVVVVGERSRGEGPRSVESGSVGVASAEGVCATEGDDLLVVEAHSVEDVPQVVLALGTVGQSSIRSAVVVVSVHSARSPRNLGSLGLLDGTDTGKRPQVTVRDPGELLLDRLEEFSGDLETVVGAVLGFGLESHSGVVGTTGAVLLVVGSGRVPGESDQDGAVGSIWGKVSKSPCIADLDSPS